MFDTNPEYYKFEWNWVNGVDGSSDFDPMLYVLTHEDDDGKILGGAWFLLVQIEKGNANNIMNPTNSYVSRWNELDTYDTAALLTLRDQYVDTFCEWLYTEKGYFEADS